MYKSLQKQITYQKSTLTLTSVVELLVIKSVLRYSVFYSTHLCSGDLVVLSATPFSSAVDLLCMLFSHPSCLFSFSSQRKWNLCFGPSHFEISACFIFLFEFIAFSKPDLLIILCCWCQWSVQCPPCPVCVQFCQSDCDTCFLKKHFCL